MKQKADWLQWFLHYLFGLFVGSIFGLRAFSKSLRSGGDYWFFYSAIIMCSAALVGAGIVSLIGDRLWIGTNYRIIPPDKMPHSDLSRIISASSIVLGSLSFVAVLLIGNRIF